MSSAALSRVQMRRMQNEYDNLHKLRHPNITRVWAFGKKGYISKPNKKTMANCLVYMRMQYVSGGNMEDFLDSMEGQLSEAHLKFLFSQMVSGLCYILQQGSAHRNLSLRTVLLTKNLTVKLSSFQHSQRISAQPK